MSTTKVVETIHTKYYKFEIVKEATTFSIKFHIYRDGSVFKGPYSSLADAVDAVRREG